MDLLAVQGILKSLLQHHSSKASILRCSAFFTVQLSHPYMTIGKAAKRSYPPSEIRGGGREELPTSKEQCLHGHRRAYKSYSTFKVRRGDNEEIPLVQGKEQRLCFAGAAMIIDCFL